jgi:hypothetical protein
VSRAFFWGGFWRWRILYREMELAYNRFTIESVKKTFGVKISGDISLFEHVVPVEPSEVLTQFLDRYLPLGSAIGTEKARSEFIIAPILAEITELTHHAVSLFSGVEFNVDEEKGLTGRCDFIFSASRVQYAIEAPILAVVEAKNDNINSGLGQCMAEMIAAQLFNEREGLSSYCIYGTVTTGSVWRFLKLQDNEIFIDKQEYFIDNLRNLLGILIDIVAKNKSCSRIDSGEIND